MPPWGQPIFSPLRRRKPPAGSPPDSVTIAGISFTARSLASRLESEPRRRLHLSQPRRLAGDGRGAFFATRKASAPAGDCGSIRFPPNSTRASAASAPGTTSITSSPIFSPPRTPMALWTASAAYSRRRQPIPTSWAWPSARGPTACREAVLDILTDLAARTWVTLELGLQTIHDRTLDWLGRGHHADSFFDAVRRTPAEGAGNRRSRHLGPARRIARRTCWRPPGRLPDSASPRSSCTIFMPCETRGWRTWWRPAKFACSERDEYITYRG